jgi:hypothetical protein
MGMNLEEVYQHYNSLDPQREISRNTPDSIIVTTTYSQFKTICGLADVKMAEFKRLAYQHFNEIAQIVGNKNLVIRLGKKPTYFEAYDVIFVHLDDEKVAKIAELFNREGLVEAGFTMLVINFIMPKKENESEPQKLKTMMVKFCPKTEDPKQFFGYIL